MTIHITPEKEFSYVSFETNMPQASYKELIDRVVNIFRPGNVVVTVFANKVRYHIVNVYYCYINKGVSLSRQVRTVFSVP